MAPRQPAFRITTSCHPLRLTAYVRSSVELSVRVENAGTQPFWVECDVSVPETLSLAPDRPLRVGRVRVGIVNPREALAGRCKVYGSEQTPPETQAVKLTAYGFGRDGSVVAREEKGIELRCEQLGR